MGSNKKEISNTKRLESLKKWSHQASSQSKQITAALRKLDTNLKSNKIVFSDDIFEEQPKNNIETNSKLLHDEKKALFGSSESEGEDIGDDYRFKSKPQFEGEKGHELFQLSSGFTDERFTLDERFKETEGSNEENSNASLCEEITNSVDNVSEHLEKEKNLELLEKVLGFQLPKCPPKPTSMKKQKYVRFDPESENADDYIQTVESVEEPKSKKQKSKKTSETSIAPAPAVSTERFFEVAEDLKEVIGSTSQTFSFSQKFSSKISENHKFYELESKSSPVVESNVQKEESDYKNTDRLEQKNSNSPSSDSVTTRKRTTPFFITSGDSRLSEGVNFFRRSQSLEEIKEHWNVIKDIVVDSYKKNRKMALRTPKSRKGKTHSKYFGHNKNQFNRNYHK